jgi:peptide/nickel transport system ATP-binding protein
MLVMYRGEIVEQGPPGEVVWSPKHAYTARLMADVPRLMSESPAATSVLDHADNAAVALAE